MSGLNYNISNGVLELSFSGDYLNEDLPESLFAAISQNNIKEINISAEKLNGWDSSLLALLFKLNQTAQNNHIQIKTSKFPAGVKELISLSLAVAPVAEVPSQNKEGFLTSLGDFGIRVYHSFLRGSKFTFHNLKLFFIAFIKKPTSRPVDFLFAIEDCAPKALPIVMLISFMVGLILAFVGAIQLQLFGAQVYIASLVTIGMTRIMAAIMVGIIMAGRTGASFAATIGTMQVNEEIDALKTMGINADEFLVLPRLLALVIAMPLLTMLADFGGILGGAAVGILALDIPHSEYFKYAYNAWFLKHFLVGIFHAFVFGFIIALSGCYFGMTCGRDADSVGKSTTSAVVYAIVWMIVATGIITFCLQRMGI